MPFYQDEVAVIRPPMLELRAGAERPDLLAARALPGRPWKNVQVRPILQTERVDADRDVKRQQWRIASRPGRGDVDLAAGDLVRLRTGELTAVIGDPARPTNPMRRPPTVDHVEVLVEEVKV